jgi:hypothetical protein
MGGRVIGALLREETSAYIGTVLVERALFEEVGGFDESLAARMDLDLVLRLAAAADAVATTDAVMAVREHRARFTATIEHPHELSALVFERLLFREGDEELRALAAARLGRLLADAAARRVARLHFAHALRLLVRSLRLGTGPRYALWCLAVAVLGRAMRRTNSSSATAPLEPSVAATAQIIAGNGSAR